MGRDSLLNKPILYLFRGETVWMVSLRGIPEEEDLDSPSLAVSPTIVPLTISRDVEVETALRLTQVKHPESEVRILNWYRPKRDV
jgi:hypothetical protein